MGRLRVIILQACVSESCIRHAVIALGALDKTSEAAGKLFSVIRGPELSYRATPCSSIGVFQLFHRSPKW
jgi:hypothetical protein